MHENLYSIMRGLSGNGLPKIALLDLAQSEKFPNIATGAGLIRSPLLSFVPNSEK
jgi:hypothetical protein